MRRAWLRIGAVVAVAAAAVCVMVFTGGARGTDHRHTYLQLNICGNACNNGELPVVAGVENAVTGRAPVAVTLNEVCENQYERLRSDLRAYQGHFDPTGPRCVNGARYGNAVLVRAARVDLIGSWALPSPVFDEARRLSCVAATLVDIPRLVVCVTHLSNELGNTAAQVEAVAGLLDGLGTTDAILLGGDLNTDPRDPHLDPLYERYQESDATDRAVANVSVGDDVLNQDTYPHHKYDYVFLAPGHWSAVSAQVADAAGGRSDHDGLWVTATLGVAAA